MHTFEAFLFIPDWWGIHWWVWLQSRYSMQMSVEAGEDKFWFLGFRVYSLNLGESPLERPHLGLEGLPGCLFCVGMIAWLPRPGKLFLTVRSLCSLWWILLSPRELLNQLKPLFSNSCWLSAMRASFLVGMSLLRIVWKLIGLFGTLGSSPDWVLQDSPPHGFCSAFLLFPPFIFTPVPSPLKPPASSISVHPWDISLPSSPLSSYRHLNFRAPALHWGLWRDTGTKQLPEAENRKKKGFSGNRTGWFVHSHGFWKHLDSS